MLPFPMVRIYTQPRSTRHTFTMARGVLARSGAASARHFFSSACKHAPFGPLLSSLHRHRLLHFVSHPERSEGCAFLLSVPASPSAFAALKITACHVPSKQKWFSTCQLSAVSSPTLSFSRGAATEARGARLRQTPAPPQAYHSCPSLTTQEMPASKSFGMRSSTKQAYNSFRIRTSITKDLKLFRMSTYEKRGRGVGQNVSQPPTDGTANLGCPLAACLAIQRN
jgi:hypothetical protein